MRLVLEDFLGRIEEKLDRALAENVEQLWLSKQELASTLGVSVRYLEYRMAEGMPHRVIAGKVMFRLTAVEAWLTRRGHLEERGTSANGRAA